MTNMNALTKFIEKNGWKTLTAVLVLVGTTFLHQVGLLNDETANSVRMYAEALGLWGIRRSIANGR